MAGPQGGAPHADDSESTYPRGPRRTAFGGSVAPPTCAMTVTSPDDDALTRWRDVVERSSLNVLLMQLSTRNIVARSATAANVFGAVRSTVDLMTNPDAAVRRLRVKLLPHQARPR